MTLFNISWTGVLEAIALAPICYILFIFIIHPLWRMLYYKKLGFSIYFYPLLGAIKRGRLYQKEHNDTMHYYREIAQKDPNMRAEAVNFGSRVSLVLYDPKLIKEFYANQQYYKKIKFSNAISTLIGTGLVTAEGSLWKNHRKIISSIFHFDFLKHNIPLIVSTTREFLGELSKTSLKKINIMDEIQKITGEIVGRIFFGENLNKYTIKGKPLTLYLAELMSRTSTIFSGSPFLFFLLFLGIGLEWVPVYKKFMGDINEFRQLCFKIVQDRKTSQIKGNDLLWLLLETQKASNAEDRFSDNDIVNEFITFFVAGMDTTGHLITMSLYLLHQNTEYLEKTEKEVSEIYQPRDPIRIEDLNQMEMMHGVLKETLRFYTPAPTVFPRLVQQDHELLGIKVMKGMSVRPTPLYNFFNPKYFEEPEKFKPERWLNKKESVTEAFVDIPFSAGARNCIGQHLALIEAKIIVAEFIKMFRFKIVPEDFKLIMAANFLYEPKNSIVMELQLK